MPFYSIFNSVNDDKFCRINMLKKLIIFFFPLLMRALPL